MVESPYDSEYEDTFSQLYARLSEGEKGVAQTKDERQRNAVAEAARSVASQAKSEGPSGGSGVKIEHDQKVVT